MRSFRSAKYPLVLLAFCPAANAGQHPGCSDPFAPLSDTSPHALREIAASCIDGTTAMLFYSRAYHADIMKDLRRLTRLHTPRSREDTARYEQGRIYVALAEEFARIAWRDGAIGAIDALNAAYDRSIETVEYTIKGYNLLISRSRAGE
jgi:hypothetical protein